jgi:hypothetical protein
MMFTSDEFDRMTLEELRRTCRMLWELVQTSMRQQHVHNHPTDPGVKPWYAYEADARERERKRKYPQHFPTRAQASISQR